MVLPLNNLKTTAQSVRVLIELNLERQLLFIFLAVAHLVTSQPGSACEKTIYQNDSRLDFFQIDSTAVRGLSAGVALVLDRRAIEKRLELSQPITHPTLQSRYRVCKGTAFSSQPSLGYCTAFLIAPDVVLTAGHCIKTATQCSRTAFLFGYTKNSASLNIFPKQQSVFYCSRILRLELNNQTGEDYALIKLNRKARNRNHLEVDEMIDSESKEIFTLGHPSGLPLKLSKGDRIDSQGLLESAYLDAFLGSSGSPVFNSESNKVVGLLVKGEKDFVYDTQKNCFRINQCRPGECRSDYFLPINAINLKKYL